MKLFYREFGTGKPLLILHGLLGMSDNWVTLGRRFSGTFRVIIPDLRNHGASPHHPVFGIPEMTDDIIGLLLELNIPKISMIGHSLGGRVAMQLCASHGALIEKCIVVDIHPFSLQREQTIDQLIRIMNSMAPSSFRSLAAAEAHIRDRMPSTLLVNFLLKNLKRELSGTLSWKLNLNAITTGLENIMNPITFGDPFPAPVLFIKGAKSNYLSAKQHELIRVLMPAAEFAEIDRAGHWVHADNPNEFFETCIEFLLRS